MFCNYCGKPLNPGEVCSCQQPQPVQQPVYGGWFTTEPATPAIAILRKHGSSVLMLLVAIFFTVTTVLNIVYSVMLSSSLNGVMPFNYESGASDAGFSFQMNFTGVIYALYIAALFMIYRSCKKPTSGYIKTAGLTIFKVFGIILIVCYVLMILIFAILGGAIIAFGEEIAYEMEALLYEMGLYGLGMTGEALGIIFGSVFLFAAAVCVFAMCVAIALVRTLNSLKNTCTTGAPATKISRFYAVMLILGAIFTILIGVIEAVATLAVGPELGVYFGFSNVIALLYYGCSSVTSILGAVLLFKVRKDMNTYVMSTVQPNFVAPAYVPNDGPTSYFYNPQPVQPVQPVAPVVEEPAYGETTVLEAPVAEEPVMEEVPVMEIPEAPVAEVPEVTIPMEEPTAEPVAEAAEELVEEVSPFTTCPNCGKSYAADANFCVYCGTPNPNK